MGRRARYRANAHRGKAARADARAARSEAADATARAAALDEAGQGLRSRLAAFNEHKRVLVQEVSAWLRLLASLCFDDTPLPPA